MKIGPSFMLSPFKPLLFDCTPAFSIRNDPIQREENGGSVFKGLANI